MDLIELIRTLLEQQPLMALFLTIAIGYLVGEINVKGFSLGVGAVLFVALAVGWFAPKAVPAPMVGTLGVGHYQGRGNTHRHSPCGLTLPGWSHGLPISSFKNETLH